MSLAFIIPMLVIIIFYIYETTVHTYILYTILKISHFVLSLINKVVNFSKCVLFKSPFKRRIVQL